MYHLVTKEYYSCQSGMPFNYFRLEFKRRRVDVAWEPLHIAAEWNMLAVCKLICENTQDKSQMKQLPFTLFYYTVIINRLWNQFWFDRRMCPFDFSNKSKTMSWFISFCFNLICLKNLFCVLICNFWFKQDTETCCTLK